MVKIEYIGKCLLIRNGKEKILCVGDLHLGYEEVLNRSGIMISREMFKEMIDYLERVFEKVGGVDYVVLLGDVKHQFGNIERQEWNEVLGLINYLKGKLNEKGEIVVVKGNHDKILEPILRNNERVILKNYYIYDKMCFMHGDRDFIENYREGIKYWIMGHGHPAIKMRDGIKTEKYKCFLEGKYKRKDIIILPSFFDYSLGSDPRENDLGIVCKFKYNKFNVRVVSEEGLEVLDFGILEKIK